MNKPTPDKKGNLYWCYEGCGFVSESHRCEQWCNLAYIPMKAIEEYIKRTTPAPTRPEAVQEAMENADIIARWPRDERDSLDDNLVDLAAYVRELEAERDRLKKLIENIATSVYEKINIKGLSGLYLSVHIHKDTWAKIQSELAGARKGR